MLRLGLVVLALVVGAAARVEAGPILTGSLIDARLCADLACDTVTMTLETAMPAPGPVTGTLDIDLEARRIDFDLVLESAVLRDADGTYLGLDNVRFSGTSALGAFVDVLGGHTITRGAAQVYGAFSLYSLRPPPLPPQSTPWLPINAGPELGGTCRQDIDIVCSISFGPSGFMSLLDGFFEVSLAASVPEPSALALMALGIAVLVGLHLADVATLRRQLAEQPVNLP